MEKKFVVKSLVLALSLAAVTAARSEELPRVEHVLIVSVDGLHQQDLANCITHQTCPNIAALAAHGVNYTKAFTPGLSDSVPGLAALLTGGSPLSTGLLYDDVYDRTLFPGTDTTCSTKPGVEVFLQELVGVDNLNPLNSPSAGAGALLHLDGGGSFNPQQVPRRKTANGDCLPVYPHDFIKTNTVFEVVKQNLKGARTAWSDKHAWGTEWLNGPSGLGVDDMARTEINSLDPACTTATVTADYTQSCSGSTKADPAYLHTEKFDNIHIENVLNQISGKDSTGKNLAPVPTIFGTNFQTLSVAQKALNAEGGGYADSAFTPNHHVAEAISYIDVAIGQMSAALKSAELRESTLFILSAKHGQTPADYTQLRKIGNTVGSTLAAAGINTIGSVQDAITGNNIQLGSITTDDVAFIWLPDQSAQTLSTALAALNANTGCPAVDATTKTIIAGQTNPGICADAAHGGFVRNLHADHSFGDPVLGRTPDIMVQPNYGVIYTKSQGKDAEHGGFAPNDSNVALLVSHPELEGRTVKSRVLTTQVAATAIKALGLDPALLEAVQKEGTKVLPSLF